MVLAPMGDRWDGINVSGEWYMGRGWVKPQPGDEARVWPGNMFPEISGLESGPAVRIGPLGSDVDWRNVHPDRVNWLLVSIKGRLYSVWAIWSVASFVAVYVGVLLHIQFLGSYCGDVVSQFLEINFGEGL